MKRELKDYDRSTQSCSCCSLTKLIPMKRELKVTSLLIVDLLSPILTKLIPMKRELKGVLGFGGMAAFQISHKANPYEKGTESLSWLHPPSGSGPHKANPYEKGTESGVIWS